YVAELTPDGVGPVRLLAERVDVGDSIGVYNSNCCRLTVDGRGRIFLRAGTHKDDPSVAGPPSTLYRVDLATGAREDLGVVWRFEPSTGGHRLGSPPPNG